MAAVTLFFMGQFTLLTYLRPFLKSVTQGLFLTLLITDGAGLAGTWLIGRVVGRRLSATLILAPLALAAIALALVAAGTMALSIALLLALWCLIGTTVPVAWLTCLSRTLPDDAEAGGGLMVAVIQLAITLGASSSGLLYDAAGYQATFLASSALLGASSLIGIACTRAARKGTAAHPEPAEDAG